MSSEDEGIQSALWFPPFLQLTANCSKSFILAECLSSIISVSFHRRVRSSKGEEGNAVYILYPLYKEDVKKPGRLNG